MFNAGKRQLMSYPILRILPFIFFRRNSFQNIRSMGERIAVLTTLILCVCIVGDWFFVEGKREFSSWGFSGVITQLFFLAATLYIFAKTKVEKFNLLTLYSLVLEIWLITWSLSYFLYFFIRNHYVNFEYWRELEALLCAWELFAISGLFSTAYSLNKFKAQIFSVLYLLIIIIPSASFNFLSSQFWYESYGDDYSEEAYYKNYKYDDILYSQDGKIEKALSEVEKGVSGQVEIFYLGFASYASENVFKHEVKFIDKLFKDNFYSKNHGLVLINDKDTLESHPLAIKRNIQLALKGLAKKMNKEDILFLYLTTHGSKDHELAVRFYPLKLMEITPPMLRELLDESGIEYRILVVSACYSGGFVEDLKNDFSLVATAASAKDTSFGCGNNRDFTYYGEALFKDNLSNKKPMLTAFEDAIASVKQRELEEKIDASNPQLFIGKSIEKQIQAFEMNNK